MWSTGYSVSPELMPVQYVPRDGTVAAATAWPSTLLGPEGTAAQTAVPRPGPGPRRRKAARGRFRPHLENCTVDASIICSCQVNKGTRWMPWHQEPKKDVGACDKPRGVGNQTSIRGFPNGENLIGRNGPSPLPEHIGQVEVTRGSETSQYPQEEKATAIP